MISIEFVILLIWNIFTTLTLFKIYDKQEKWGEIMKEKKDLENKDWYKLFLENEKKRTKIIKKIENEMKKGQ